MNLDLGQWPTLLHHADDCAYCVSGFVPASDPVCGPGYFRCPNLTAHGKSTACPACGVTAFYPLEHRTDLDGWLNRVNRTYRLVPHICPTCVGVTGLTPIPPDWRGGA